jgi:hypothetical protein
VLSKRQLVLTLAASLLVTAGCARIKGMLGKGGVNQDSLKAAAAAQARKDSLARAQAVRDSLARVHWIACSDSVEKVLRKTAKGRKELAGKKKRPAGMLLPSVLKACGGAPPPPPAPKPVAAAPAGGKPAAPAPGGANTKPDTAHPAAAKPSGVVAAPGNAKPATPAPTAGKPGPAPATAAPAPAAAKPGAQPPAAAKPAVPALTPAQLRVARADSIRKAKDAARADSIAKVREQARVDSIARVRADSIRQDSLRVARETEVLRESFAYGGGSRDPFQSLIQRNSSSVEFGDLVLIGIYQDLRSPRNSVALLRDKNSGRRYKVHIGEKVGSRMTVAQITERDVMFTIQDFGFERQETLSLPKKGEEAIP